MPQSLTPDESQVLLEPIQKISRDLIKSARTIPLNHVRYLVDYYYQLQEMRKRANSQVILADKVGDESSEVTEPVDALAWMFQQTKAMESTIKRALNAWTEGSEVGVWCKSITGIGPVLTAGLMAHIDIEKASTVGKIWSFAGLNPTVKWEKGERRPWNAKLKVLTWKIGESFIKVQNNENDVYGKMFVQRKRQEWEQNLSGENQAAALAIITGKKFGKDTQAIKWYSGHFDPVKVSEALSLGEGLINLVPSKKPNPEWAMLPPAQIHARARRWAVKLFLSHYHEVAFWVRFKQPPPSPYVFAHLGHVDRIAPPNFHLIKK